MKLTANPAWLSLPPNKGKGSGAKFLRIMKLTTIIILAASLHTSAKGVAQQTITFSGKEVSLESVFSAIKKQTNYRFFFNTDMLQNASKVTLEVKNAQVEQVMNMALKDQPLTFTIKGRTIFIMKKPEEESNQIASPVSGDPVTISGRVTDEKGQPLVGANVKIKGGNVGTTTDNQGRFTLSNIDDQSFLEVSFVGYDPKLIPVKGKTIFTVALGQRQSVLDETIVIAYGTTSRRFATGNIASVKAKDIESQPVNNALLALQGRVPGIFIEQANGLPGTGVKVRIQGQNSLSKGNNPLYVIDGVPFVSEMLPAVSNIQGNSGDNGATAPGGVGNGNPLSYINPNDIESVEILKDADATSIYGSRAANGAILITTKRGKAGMTKASFNLQHGWSKVAKFLKVLDTEQYLEMRNEAFVNDGTMPKPTDYDLNGTWDKARYTNWQKELIGGTATYSDGQVTLTGGNANTTFLLGGGYHRESLVFPGGQNDQKASLHVNFNHAPAKGRIRIQFDGKYLTDVNNLINNDLTILAIQIPPNAPSLIDENGQINWAGKNDVSTWKNPLAYLYNQYKLKVNNLIANTLLSYQVVSGLDFKVSLGYTNMQKDELLLNPLLSTAPELRSMARRQTNFCNGSITSWIIEPHLIYNKKFNNGTLEVLVGSTLQKNSWSQQILTGRDFSTDAVMEDLKAAPEVTVNSTVSTIYRYNAVFGRINFNWKDKYVININARRDGSSRFGAENLFHNFGSIGAAWLFSNEKFVKESFPFLSFGKLKASYGVTGNDAIGDYRFMNLYSFVSRQVPYQNVVGLQPTGFNNPYLQWEETRKLQVGGDLSFLRDKILVNATYYVNRSSNQLQTYALPIITGNNGIETNFPATIQNYGWEFSLQTINVKNKNFTWSNSINLTIPKNKLVEYKDLENSSYANSYIIGRSIFIRKLYQNVGVDESTGIYQYFDVNGNIINTPGSLDENIVTELSPKFYGGFQNSFSYKGFGLDLLFQFVKQLALDYRFGNKPGYFISNANTDAFGNQPVTILSRWQKVGDHTTVQKLSAEYPSSVNEPYSRIITSDANLVDGTFMRLKNISLSYLITQRLLKSLKISDARIYAQGQNIFTITNYKGLDPETRSVTSLPPLRVITFGIQVTF